MDFVDVTGQLGLGNVEGVPMRFTDVVLSDYDGDGDLDLYTTLTGMLFQNTGEQFYRRPRGSRDTGTAGFTTAHRSISRYG